MEQAINWTALLTQKLTGVVSMVEYSASVDMEAKRAGKSVSGKTLLDYSDVTLMDLIDLSKYEIKVNQLQKDAREDGAIKTKHIVRQKGRKRTAKQLSKEQLLKKADALPQEDLKAIIEALQAKLEQTEE